MSGNPTAAPLTLTWLLIDPQPSSQGCVLASVLVTPWPQRPGWAGYDRSHMLFITFMLGWYFLDSLPASPSPQEQEVRALSWRAQPSEAFRRCSPHSTMRRSP